MNYTKKILSLLLALTMVFAMAVSVGAQDVDTQGGGNATITITNAAKGVEYAVYKLFGATVSTDTDHSSIAYTGEIPTGLSSYFTKDSAGNITATDAAGSGENMSDGLKAALKTWVESEQNPAGTATANGGSLVFKNLSYGYYVVKTNQGEAAVSVDSTKPDATIHDKNTTTPTVTKTADGESYNIGGTITYTLTFTTANYDGETLITQYEISDTLPEWLSNVNVTSVKIGDEEYKVESKFPQFGEEKKITIPWSENNTPKYANGTTVTIVYTATLNEKATIGGTGNTNTATLTYNNRTAQGSDVVYSYSFDVVKTDSSKKVLDGAKFKLYSQQSGGTAISFVKDESANTYRVATSTDTNTTDEIVAGKATIKGLKAGTYYLEETAAPAGYNKLTERQAVTITNANLEATVTDNTYTSGGVQVVNQTGTELPSTGGMGTTIFYILGSVLVLAAVVLLVTKKRMGRENA